MSTSKNKPEVVDPFSEYIEELENGTYNESSIFIDLTDKLDTAGKESVKIRLTQLTDAVSVKKKHGPPTLDVYQSMVSSKSSIEGVLPRDSLPTEGEVFKLNYHMFDDLLEFGLLESSTSLTHVICNENYYYFQDGEGLWRLEVVTDYN